MNVVGIFVQPDIKSVRDFFKTSKKSLAIFKSVGLVSRAHLTLLTHF